MSRVPRLVLNERPPLPVGKPLHDGAWAIAEFVCEGGRHLQYKAMGRALRKSALKEYFPPVWRRDGDLVIPDREPEMEHALRRFYLEGLRIAREVPSHPSLLVTYDLFEERGTHYAAYEWHEGLSLAELLRRTGALPIAMALSVVEHVGSALGHLHGLQLLHRDVNPFNVLVQPGGKAHLADYETLSPYPAARQFTGMTLVNPDFAPIELLSTFSSYGPESDVYSLAALAYLTLTGKRPTPSAQRAANPRLAPAHQIKPGIPVHISKALDRALSLRSKERTPTVLSFLDDLLSEPV